MTINTNEKTGIPFGYIAADKLDPEIVTALQMTGKDVHYDEAWSQFLAEKRTELGLHDGSDEENGFEPQDYQQEFDDSYNPDEPVHEGELEGVTFRTSWLGGALNVWIFESPYITHRARKASPCVPGAAILDTLDGGETGYDVPPDWRAERWAYNAHFSMAKPAVVEGWGTATITFYSGYELPQEEMVDAALAAAKRLDLVYAPGTIQVALAEAPEGLPQSSV